MKNIGIVTVVLTFFLLLFSSCRERKLAGEWIFQDNRSEGNSSQYIFQFEENHTGRLSFINSYNGEEIMGGGRFMWEMKKDTVFIKGTYRESIDYEDYHKFNEQYHLEGDKLLYNGTTHPGQTPAIPSFTLHKQPSS